MPISRKHRVAIALSALLTPMPAWAAALPSTCAPTIEASNVPVTRVEKNGVLVLVDGRAVHLEGLLLPQGARDHAPNFLAEQAVSTLSDLSRDRTVTLAVNVPKEDRYGRLRAQVEFPQDNDEPWLQIAMLRRGLARVSIAPDRRECASELYAAEAEARKNKYGIWTSAALRRPQRPISLRHDGHVPDRGGQGASTATCEERPRLSRFRRGLAPRFHGHHFAGRHARLPRCGRRSAQLCRQDGARARLRGSAERPGDRSCRAPTGWK